VGGAPVGRRSQALTRGGALQNGPTPLQDAAGKGDLEVVRSLLKAGANKDATGNTALARVGAIF
jgi:ankyrin repeat protein